MRNVRDRRYHFVSRWTVEAPPDAVYAAIYAVADYPAWWPEVKETRQVDDDRMWMRTRSVLPYDLAFELERTIAEPRSGILEARLTGHLDGVIRWSIEDATAGCVITFDEDVALNKPALNRLSSIVRPAYVANHWVMMAHGQAGLRTFLGRQAQARREALPD